MEFGSHGERDKTQETPPLDILHDEETQELINRALSLYRLGLDEDADDIVSDLLLDWSGQPFNVVGYGHLVDNGRTDWYTKNPAEVFNCPAIFQRPAIIDDKFCLVFWPESDIITNPDGSQTAITELVIEKGNLLDLQYGEDTSRDALVDYTDKAYLDHLASRAHRMMSLAINRPDLSDLDRPDKIRETADAIRNDEDIAAYSDVYENRIMELSPRRYFTAPPTDIAFDARLCLSDNTSEPTLTGMFSGLIMLEELDTNHQPNIASLCIKLLCASNDGEIAERYVPIANLICPPICNWTDADGVID